jgi:aminotransferase
MLTQANSSLALSRKAASIVQSEIRAMSVECERVNGINLAQGVCDTEVPRPVRDSAQLAIGQAGLNSYSRYDGLAELRQAIAWKARTYNGINADPEVNVTATAGSTAAFYCACLALLNPGDEVILFEPYYGYHVNTLMSCDAVPAYVTLRPPKWTFTQGDLESALTQHTRAIMVNTPANPSGKVFSVAELEWIGSFAEQYELFVFTDEIYENFVYDGRRHISPGSLPGMAERAITISGFSKVFSITGWRIGYCISDARYAQMIGYLHDLVYVCAPVPFQYAVACGIKRLQPDFYRELTADYSKKRDQLCQALKDAGLEPCVPEGAYYVLANASALPGPNSKEKARYLLSRMGVAAVPGEAFFHGSEGDSLLRFCFAKPNEELDRACERLRVLA